MYSTKAQEKELENKIKQDFFKEFDTTKQLGKIDFCISYKADNLFAPIHFLWAEAKKGNKADIIESFVQLILTIGKERTFENELPPLFLGAFDAQNFAFIPYYEIMHIFAQNDFNWNVTPSNHNSKEFKQLHTQTKALLESLKLQFDFKADSKELRDFIKANFSISNPHLCKVQITKNNFTNVYQKWLLKVKDSISIDWELAKNAGILDADFYLADLLSEENMSIKDKLFVALKKTYYEYNKQKTDIGSIINEQTAFKDNQKAHTEFWNLYERPPREEYWDYIIDRRDLLVPSDIRERKGAFFTPQMWVQKAQSYLAKALGENWQEEYYVWDCAAGTGNLFANLTESRNLYASTLDKADVKIMQELAQNKRLPLLENHIFQFDFLNDSFFDKPCEKHKFCHTEPLGEVSQSSTNRDISASPQYDKGFANPTCKDCQASKLPKLLQEILKDETKRKKLVIFINPPYAEASSATTPAGTGANKPKVATENAIYRICTGKGKVVGINIESKDYLGKASNEIFAQFFMRIYLEIPHCTLASFSTLKYLNSSNFVKFRETFEAKFLAGFMCPADTFDNVKGQFPIGFLVWDLSETTKK